MDVIIDGAYSVEETLSAIQYQERLGYQLVSLSPGPESAHLAGAPERRVNYASFLDLEEPGRQPPAIDMAKVVTPPGPAALITARLAQGWVPVVVSRIFAAGKLTDVIVFRKL